MSGSAKMPGWNITSRIREIMHRQDMPKIEAVLPVGGPDPTRRRGTGANSQAGNVFSADTS